MIPWNRILTITKTKDKTLQVATNNERHKMVIKSPKEADFPLKQEAHSQSIIDPEKAKVSSSSAAQLPRLKDPRIVRVSRAFGGKDRHSKVCTIRGLRDRRVRLSVPTAIQLYDLQDRLGLNQPSKVVDWLLNAAKHEIDELPPLPIVPSVNNFTLGYPFAVTSNEATTSHSQPGEHLHNINRSIQWEGSSQNSTWKLNPKEVSEEMVVSTEKASWINRSEEDKQGNNNEGPSTHVVPNNLLPRANHPSFLGLLNTMPHGFQWEPSPSDASHQLGNNEFSNQTDIHSINVVPFPTSTLSLSTGNSQILCPPGATQTYFPSHVTAMDMDPRQINHYRMLSSDSQNPLTNSLNYSFSFAMMSHKPLDSPNSSKSPSHKDQDFPSN
ncbi:hypothetical protein VNO78_14926 [Psophocarpus tetragonolobus]|uniref:TCP domain-containing protein n=1 Tax=Psophocarpus tetragonolobus TaxID=3891 RepID=A0AAN9SF04_PSOTE